MTDRPTLKRSLSLPLITLYGLGTTIGAGIYVLIGKVAGNAQGFAPLSFLMASVLVAFSALSFAELSARYPRSAGEAVYLHEAFGSARLSLLTGLLVTLAGLVSAATITSGFVGYLQQLVPLPGWIALAGIVLLLGALAAWGIAESVSVAAAITLVEVGGLLFVIWSGRASLGDLPARLPELLPPFESGAWLGILAGSVIAFYAFIGFEDMVNVAEEVKDAPRTLPRAIILTLVLTTVLYLLVSLVAVLAVPVAELAESTAPVALLVQRTTAGSGDWISVTAIVAVLNGALIQIIMASRVLYGLSACGWLPAGLSRVHPARRTPTLAVAMATAIVLLLAFLFPLEALARGTSLITLLIFAIVNVALWRIKARRPVSPELEMFPRWVCMVGFLTCAAVLLAEILRQTMS